MSIKNDRKLKKLQCSFPKLTDENQQYMLGFAEGLRHAQENTENQPEKSSPLLWENERQGWCIDIFEYFISESTDVLKIYNDNYGKGSLDQLDKWCIRMTSNLIMTGTSHRIQRNEYIDT